MSLHYLKLALRRFRREPGYAALNLVGLTVGLATCFYIVQFVQWELSYDEFHEDADRIYRVVGDISPLGEIAVLHASVGAALEESVPEVQHGGRVVGLDRPLVRADGRSRYEAEGFVYADPGVFDVFTWPLVAGDPDQVLTNPFSVVLSRSLADRLFGAGNPVGRTMEIDGQTYTVTGVMADLTRNTHLRPEAVLSLSTLKGSNPRKLEFSTSTYVLLQEGADPSQVASIFPKAAPGIWEKASFSLEPLTDIYLHSEHSRASLATSDPRYLYIFSAIGVLILLLAAVNYTNLATARSAKRRTELGIQRALGASRSQVMRQVLVSAVLTTLVAGLLAVGLSYLASPFIRQIAGTSMGIGAWTGLELATLGGMVLAIGLLSGLYPAYRFASTSPGTILGGGRQSRSGGSPRLRKGLIVVQLAISVALIGSTLIIDRQLGYVQEADLGFNEQGLLTIQIDEAPVRGSYETIRNELTSEPAVSAVTASFGFPLKNLNSLETPRTDVEDGRIRFTRFAVDDQFLETLGIDLIAGRPLEQASTDTSATVLVNEAMIRELGMSDPIGKTLPVRGLDTYKVTGLVQDFHIKSLKEPIGPVLIKPLSALEEGREGPNFITVRFREARAEEALTALRSAWEEVAPQYPLNYFFVDGAFAQQYQSDRQIARLFTTFSGIAILIACLGIFGLAGYMAQRRSKEISIRKVLGATITSVVGLISWEFVKLALISLVVGIPAAYVGIQWWLQDFAFQVQLGPWVFLGAGAIGVLLVFVVAGYHALQAGLTNPAKTLKYE